MQIDHFVMNVNDINATLQFYKNVLGAEVVDYEAWKAGNAKYPALLFTLQKIHLHSKNTHEEISAASTKTGNFEFCFHWDGNISAAVEHLAQHGVPIELGPVERMGTHGKGKSVFFRDPDGNLLEFISYLP